MNKSKLSLALWLSAVLVTSAEAKATPFAIAIHGGAGTINKNEFPPEKQQAYKDTLQAAVNAGYQVLAQGGSSQQAVIDAVMVLENSPFFNAGVGAVYTHDEEHELDASIMLGHNRQAGAITGVKRIKNPILLANEVMQNSVHVMLSGQGAENFAIQQGYQLVDNSVFDTEHRYQALQRAKQKMLAKDQKQYQAKHLNLDSNYKMGTVGAVALDKHGNLAAATSTGGMTNKRFNRIGDAPIIGAGTFAENDSCAVSATGHGEYFIRYNVAADICARVKYQGLTIDNAANQVIHDVLLPVGGTGGVIVVDSQGNIAMPFNTAGMYRASKSSTGETQIKIFKDE
ncbi:isoaspartyl peptidase/L-asparaginase family protein [Paraferrimonas sp. SM1919]|uniref:isoaspartyl peptidase/L-asparaginase family protein n=1 Tax=Paraferrimonas sp. SM1919 TaxID=2662263 RepID=UPI0013D7C0FC|nr:isoaspartyl peptidase/L-asparaginase [Paraferrimonas sp. SM1919]